MSIARLVLVCCALLAASATPAFAAGTLQVGINGPGRVAGVGIDCNRGLTGGVFGDCSQQYDNVRECFDGPLKPICLLVPPTVSVTASAGASGFAFDGWSGECGGQPATCTLALNEDQRVTASFKDIQDPGVSLVNPGAVLRGTVTLTATASDNAGVARVDFSLGGVTVSDATAPYAATFAAGTVRDGATQAKAVAVDTSGRTRQQALNVLVDNTAPTAVVTGPDAAAVGPSTTPSWTIAPSDGGSGVASVGCSLVASGAPADFKPCGAAFSAPGLGHGDYALTVRVTDKAGNAGDVTRTFSVDAVAPVTSVIAGPAHGAVTSATALTWAFTAEPGASFACRVYPAALTPGAFAPCSGAGSHSAAGFAPGVYTFEVQATDAVGNVEAGSAKRTFTIVPAPTAGVTPPALQGAAKSGRTAPQIRVSLVFTFRNSTKKQTKLTSLVVRGVPAGSTVTAKGFKKRNAKGTVSLKKLIRKPFKAGTKIVVKVSKPGMATAIKTLKILPRKTPKVTTRCQAPGAKKSKAC